MNGREISIKLKKFGSWADDFEKEYDGNQLSEIIDEWFNKNTKNNRYSHTENTENMQFFDQVRIPLFDANGKAIDARAYCRNLQKFLEAAPYSIPCKITTKGLGQASLLLGYNK